MVVDLELETWQRRWQTAAPAVPDFKARVERETRAMRWQLAGEILITVVFGGGTMGWAVASQRIDAIVLAAGVWSFIAIAWVVGLLLRRDAWAPTSLTTQAFLDLSILRCRRRREAIVAQVVLYVLILTFDLAWIYVATPHGTRYSVGAFLVSPGVAWVWLVTAVLAWRAVRRRRRLGHELARLTALAEQLREMA
jgi:hypothetical protein